MVTSSTQYTPELSTKFCSDCGAGTLAACEACKTSIRGYYHVEGFISVSNRTPVPRYCYSCGASFPWTEAAVEAAREMTETLDGLTDAERERLKKSLDDLVRDTPRTDVAATWFKKLMVKAGAEGASGMKSVLVNVVTDAAKRAIWGV
jgi:hypothetical protein